MGRFASEDVYRGDGLNLYAYCANNPVTYYDPSGYSGIKSAKCNTGPQQEHLANDADDLVTVYRGTDKYTEQLVYDETGLIMSDSARTKFLETGDLNQAYEHSQTTHKEWIDIWGDQDTYVQAHGEFGTELSQAFNKERSMVSVTTDKGVAELFAGGNGVVYELQVPKSDLIPQTIKGAGESEYLIINGTRK